MEILLYSVSEFLVPKPIISIIKHTLSQITKVYKSKIPCFVFVLSRRRCSESLSKLRRCSVQQWPEVINAWFIMLLLWLLFLINRVEIRDYNSNNAEGHNFRSSLLKTFGEYLRVRQAKQTYREIEILSKIEWNSIHV